VLSKTQRAIDYLELVPDPHRNDILTIAEKVDSSERTVYRALKQLREKRQRMATEHDFMKGLMSDVIFLVSFIKGKTSLKGSLLATDRVRLDRIGKLIETFKADIGFQEYMKLKGEMESSE